MAAALARSRSLNAWTIPAEAPTAAITTKAMIRERILF